MELAGNEKKIQALFCELKFADELVTPDFSTMWKRAQAGPTAAPRGFKLSFALALAVVAITVGSLAIWSRNWERIQTTSAVVNVLDHPGLTIVPSVIPSSIHAGLAEPPQRHRIHRSVRKLAARPQPEINANAVIPEAVAISSWQSPTATLLQSPANDMLTSLPHFDLSVRDLKTFLPDTLQ